MRLLQLLEVARRPPLLSRQLGLMAKDVNLCIAEAEALGVPMWIGSAVKQLWLYGLAQGGPEQDFTELIKHLEKWAGVTVRGSSI